ncbi:MAG: NigD-like C-terminal domain-containing protein [Proteiniphilum sp.]|jgi:hypothetical protein
MRRATFVFLVLFFLVPGCEKDPGRMDDYLVEFATLIKEGDVYHFRLDNGQVLIAGKVENMDSDDGQRVILNYVPLTGDSIRVNYASPIFTASIETEGYPERYSNDPVKLQSAWVGGDYLNLIMEVEYHSKSHSLALFRDNSSASIDLYISHSRNDDPPGYPQVMYSSFLITGLREGGASPTPFRLFINTHTGLRVLELELK